MTTSRARKRRLRKGLERPLPIAGVQSLATNVRVGRRELDLKPRRYRRTKGLAFRCDCV